MIHDAYKDGECTHPMVLEVRGIDTPRTVENWRTLHYHHQKKCVNKIKKGNGCLFCAFCSVIDGRIAVKDFYITGYHVCRLLCCTVPDDEIEKLTMIKQSVKKKK